MILPRTVDPAAFASAFPKISELMIEVFGVTRRLPCAIKRYYSFPALPKVPEEMDVCRSHSLHTSISPASCATGFPPVTIIEEEIQWRRY